MSTRVGFYCPIKGLENQWVVIPVTDHIGNNATVIEVEDRAEIDLVYFNSLIPFQLCYVGQPFLVWLIRMKFAVKIILCNILRIFSLSCAAVVIVLDGRFDSFNSANTKNALVVHIDMFVVPKVVIDATIALIRVFHMNLLDPFPNLLILHSPGTLFPGCPAKISGTGNA